MDSMQDCIGIKWLQIKLKKYQPQLYCEIGIFLINIILTTNSKQENYHLKLVMPYEEDTELSR